MAKKKKILAPECDKALAVQKESQKIEEFIEWLEKQNLCICEKSDSNDAFLDDFYYITDKNTKQLLAEYFDIDLEKVEKEKWKILKQLRQ